MSSSYRARPPAAQRSGVLGKAYAAGAALVAAIAAITGVFVVKIADSYATSSSTPSGNTVTNNQGSDTGNLFNGSGDDQSGGGFSAPQNQQLNQPPVGGSHGS